MLRFAELSLWVSKTLDELGFTRGIDLVECHSVSMSKGHAKKVFLRMKINTIDETILGTGISRCCYWGWVDRYCRQVQCSCKQEYEKNASSKKQRIAPL